MYSVSKAWLDGIRQRYCYGLQDRIHISIAHQAAVRLMRKAEIAQVKLQNPPPEQVRSLIVDSVPAATRGQAHQDQGCAAARACAIQPSNTSW